MPSLSNKALLCELGVYAADNSIRRGVLLTTTNTQSDNNSISDISTTINAGDTVSLTPLPVNGQTIIRSTGGPIRVTIKFGDPTDAASLTAVTFDVASLLVLTTQIASLSVLNPSVDTKVQLRAIQI